MQIAGAKAILEKSSEKTYREKTARGTKILVNYIETVKPGGHQPRSANIAPFHPHKINSYSPV